MGRLLVVLLLGIGALSIAPAAAPARTDDRAALVAAYKTWVPVLIADQKRLFSTTRTFLGNPDDMAKVLTANARLDDDRIRAYQAFHRLDLENSELWLLRNRMTIAFGMSKLGLGTSYWRSFVKRYFAAAHSSPAFTSEQKRVINGIHGNAEERFRSAWTDVAHVDDALGHPLATPKPPAAPPVVFTPAGDPILGDWTAWLTGGLMRVDAAGSGYEATRIEPMTQNLCIQGRLPLGRVEWKIQAAGSGKYTGSARSYRFATCSFEGWDTTATWQYLPHGVGKLAGPVLTFCADSWQGCTTYRRPT